MEAALLIIAIGLVLMAFAPVAPSGTSTTGPGLRVRIARQLHLWDRYLLNPPGGEIWRE